MDRNNNPHKRHQCDRDRDNAGNDRKRPDGDDNSSGEKGPSKGEESSLLSPRKKHRRTMEEKGVSPFSIAAAAAKDDSGVVVATSASATGVPSLSINDLSDDLLVNIFKFVGRGHNFYVSGTSHRFKDLYQTIDWNINPLRKKEDYGCTEKKKKNNNNKSDAKTTTKKKSSAVETKAIFKKTSLKSVVESVSRSKMYVEDLEAGRSKLYRLRTIARNAARLGSLSVFRYAMTHPGYAATLKNIYGVYLFNTATRYGNLDLMKWMRKNGYQWDGIHTSAFAASQSNVEILKWLHENNCPRNELTCSAAASCGHLDVLQYLRRENCKWDANACSSAASKGHLEVLKWLREQGCPWDGWTREYAELYGHTVVLQWAIENGCPIHMPL